MKKINYDNCATELYNYLQNKQRANPKAHYDVLVYYARLYADMYKEDMEKFIKENNITDENLGLARFYYKDKEKYEGEQFDERFNAAIDKKLEALKTLEDLKVAMKYIVIDEDDIKRLNIEGLKTKEVLSSDNKPKSKKNKR